MFSPSPRNSSLASNLRESPYKDWLLLARTYQEYNNLIKTFQGVPKVWLEWVEKRTVAYVKRGVQIEKPLEYRLQSLWNGVILLQEGKFICDSLENAFRQGFFDHVSLNSIVYRDLSSSIPNWPGIKKMYERDYRTVITLDLLINLDFIFTSTFYQLTETMARNWKYLTVCTPWKLGFRKVFRGKYCRDINNFREDMKEIRKFRNTIAHSKRLFSPDEIQQLYEVSLVWLKPLNVELGSKILAYRSRRPRFLEPLVMR